MRPWAGQPGRRTYVTIGIGIGVYYTTDTLNGGISQLVTAGGGGNATANFNNSGSLEVGAHAYATARKRPSRTRSFRTA